MPELSKHHRHDHFWIDDEVLYESYHTIRGMRYMERLQVPGMPDNDHLNEAALKYIEVEYLE